MPEWTEEALAFQRSATGEVRLVAMKKEEIEEIRECLDWERQLYRYASGAYALQILKEQVGTGVCVSQLKSGRFQRLLSKPLVKQAVALTGNGILTTGHLDLVFPHSAYSYSLTLGVWGHKSEFYYQRRYSQVTRHGANLVLQLNFNRSHDAVFQRIVKRGKRPFESSGHPSCKEERSTIAWARIDLDFGTGEALIEEIQNDWLRYAWQYQRSVEAWERGCRCRHCRQRASENEDYYFRDVKKARSYIESLLAPHKKVWAEAMLSSALWFIQKELGISRVFYHTWEGGCARKGIDAGSAPPRSLYTDLPEKFCFDLVQREPEFLRAKKKGMSAGKRRKEGRVVVHPWYMLDLSS
jgi:hypothetical protein